MYILKLSPEADEELTLSAQWYKERSAGLGDRFIEPVKNKLELIRQFPGRYPIMFKHYHETPLKDFPYIIVYSISGSQVVISSIFHTSRQPSKKYRSE